MTPTIDAFDASEIRELVMGASALLHDDDGTRCAASLAWLIGLLDGDGSDVVVAVGEDGSSIGIPRQVVDGTVDRVIASRVTGDGWVVEIDVPGWTDPVAPYRVRSIALASFTSLVAAR